jgi:hypothetical protein
MLLSLKVFRLRWPAHFKLFSCLLIAISLTELLAISWKYYLHTVFGNKNYSNSNLWLYNILLAPQYLLYMQIYCKVIRSHRIKKIISLLKILYPIFVVINLLYFQPLNTINSYSIIVSSTITVFLTITYFEQLRNDNEIISLKSNPMVWLSLGGFIFHAANLPYIISLNYLISNNLSLAVALYYIYLGLNCIMYTLYSIAFLCRNPLQK